MIKGLFDRSTAMEVTRRGLECDTSNEADDWAPGDQDKHWQREHMEKFPDGGMWAVPGTASTFQVYKSKKLLVLRAGNPDLENNRRIIKTVEAIGWTVEVKVSRRQDALFAARYARSN